MKIALIDDEQVELDLLSKYILQELSESVVINTFNSSEEFIKNWNHGDYDVVIIDIFMKEMLGIDLARKIREIDKVTRVVFCSSSNDFASESYEVNACYHIRKPISQEKVKVMFNRLNLEEIERTRSVVLPNRQSVILRNIIYIDYISHIAIIHNKKGGNISVGVSQLDMESLLCKYSYFMCCSKGVIVNFYEVKNQKDNVFIMKSGERLPISRRKFKAVLNAYIDFHFNEMRNESEY